MDSGPLRSTSKAAPVTTGEKEACFIRLAMVLVCVMCFSDVRETLVTLQIEKDDNKQDICEHMHEG